VYPALLQPVPRRGYKYNEIHIRLQHLEIINGIYFEDGQSLFGVWQSVTGPFVLLRLLLFTLSCYILRVGVLHSVRGDFIIDHRPGAYSEGGQWGHAPQSSIEWIFF